MYRYFLALEFDNNTQTKLSEISNKIFEQFLPVTNIKPVKKNNFHITVKYYGFLNTINPVLESIQRLIPADINHYKFIISSVKCFLKKRESVIWLDGDYSTLKTDFYVINPDLIPHITIARVKQLIPLNISLDIPLEISPSSLSLLRSKLTPAGPVYEQVTLLKTFLSTQK